MKKTLLTIAVALASFLGINVQATAQTTKTFTDYLVVTVNEDSSDPQAANIDVTVNSDVMTFSLKNFCLGAGDDILGIGNISLDNIQLTESDVQGLYSFEVIQAITITEGDLEEIDTWFGPMLGDIPIVLKGNICNEKLYVTIDIDMMELLGQIIHVEVGTLIDNKSMSDKTYLDFLVVTVNEESSAPQLANIQVNAENDKMTFSLKNFCLGSGEDVLGVGDITLEDIELTAVDGKSNVYDFKVTRNITITEGDLEEIEMWFGPMLGEIPIVLKGTICDKKLYVTIDIDMQELLEQTISVEVGTPFDYTILFPEEPSTFTLTFIVDGETISSEELEEGAVVTAPEVAEREGYTFTWTGEVPETMPGEDVTINGSYTINKYKVTFKVGDDIVSEEEMEYGATITVPEIEEREGYTFYWRSEAPATVPAEDVEAYGEYVINQYWVQIIVDGEAVVEQLQDYGSPIVAPEVEEREGYTFAWDSEIPETVPAGNILVHGNYTVNQYTITFMLDGQVYAEYTLDYGTEITAPEVTGGERYSFSGWDEVPETMPAHDVVVSGGMVDGVANVQRSSFDAKNTYDLAGKRVDANSARGIVIVNGKKILKR